MNVWLPVIGRQGRVLPGYEVSSLGMVRSFRGTAHGNCRDNRQDNLAWISRSESALLSTAARWQS